MRVGAGRAFGGKAGVDDGEAVGKKRHGGIRHDGTKGRFDTELLRASNGKLICKIGAEAVYAVGALPCEKFPRGLGMAFKIEDGSYRGLGPAVIEALVQLGVLDDAESARLASFPRPIVDNRRGQPVGEARAIFDLRFNRQ